VCPSVRKSARGPEITWQVVGVVKDEKVGGKVFRLDEDIPVVYVTFYQSPGTHNSRAGKSEGRTEFCPTP